MDTILRLNTLTRPLTTRWIIRALLLAAVFASACTAETAPTTRAPAESATPTPPATALRPSATPRPRRTPTPTEPASTLGAQARDLEGVSLDLWHMWSWETGEALEALVADFNRSNPHGIQVRTLNQGGYGDLEDALFQALASETLPDVVVGFGNQLLTWERAGASLVDLEPYLEDPIWGWDSATRADFYPAFLPQETADGRRIGLPAQRTAQVVVYNRTWAQELGFDEPPETVSAFAEQTCAAAEVNLTDSTGANDGTGGWPVDTSTATTLGWIHAFGGEVVTDTGYDFEGEETEAAFLFLKELFDEGCAWISKNRYPDPDFAARHALLATSSTTGLPYLEEAMLAAENEDEWVVLPLPGESGEPILEVSGPSFAVLESTPEEQLAAWLLIQWLHEPENQARWIRASGSLPGRASTMERLEVYREAHPQWAAVEAFLPHARPEPERASWGLVRWALSDAADQVFRLDLSFDQIPALLEELDQTAAELHAQARGGP